MSEPVLDAKDSASYKVYNAVIFMELSFWREETANANPQEDENPAFSLQVLWRR